jgi:hypothetical protein
MVYKEHGTIKSYKNRELALFLEKFAELISAEVPLLQALEIASQDVQDSILQHQTMEMKEKMERGQSITDTFAEYPELFSHFHLAIVDSGEKLGRLEDSLTRLAQNFRREIRTEKPVIPGELPKPSTDSESYEVQGLAQVLNETNRQLAEIKKQLAAINQTLRTRESSQSDSNLHKPKGTPGKST